jgi:hypothetical protein
MHTTSRSTGHQYSRIQAFRSDSDSHRFFNVLTSESLLDKVEEMLPEHRERLYAPTQSPSIFLTQARNADCACQHIVNQAVVRRLACGVSASSSHTGGYCRTRQPLPHLHRKCLLAAFLLAGSVAGCTSIPEEAYQLPPSSQSVREVQTRTFDVQDETNILQVAVALMQDMEYNFDTVDYELGILSGSKVVDADSLAQLTGRIIVDIFLGASGDTSFYAGADDEISLTITLVVLPSLENKGQYTARMTIQSELIDKVGRVRKARMIEKPVIYQEIFEKLSKSLFLEGVER